MTTTGKDLRLMTMQEAADRLGVSPRFVRSAVHDRSIAAVRIGRLVRFRPEHLEEYVESRSSAPQRVAGPDRSEGH